MSANTLGTRYIGTGQEKCAECRYFIQHYGLFGTRYVAVNAGHCVRGNRVKQRKRENRCEFYEKGRFPW